MPANLHLLKLFVGLSTLPELVAFQEERLAAAMASGGPRELFHVTRHTPKQADALLAGGSIYWILSGAIVARQRLIALRPVAVDGVPHCQIVFDPSLVAILPRPHRPFQGWRYLSAKDAPGDFAKGAHPEGLPASMALELARLGLL